MNGDKLLISWKVAFYTILNKDASQAIDDFFSEEKVQQLLSHPFNAFPEPSQQTKSAFDTKTSAINVTPSSSTRFNIKEVKEDALWLSKEAKLDEISALRIVVEECQNRPSAQLLGPFSNEELAGIQDAVGQSQSSIPVTLLSQAADAERIRKDFETQDSRRYRLLRAYLSERYFLVKCTNYLLQNTLYRSSLGSENEKDERGEVSLSPTEKIGRALEQQIFESRGWLLDCIRAIRSNVQKTNEGSGWYKEDGDRKCIEIEWTNAQIAEATQIMEIMFQIIDMTENVASSAAVLEWIELMDSYNFLQFNTEEPTTQKLTTHLESITAIISVSILGVLPCIEHMQDIDDKAVTDSSSAPYIVNPTAIRRIQDQILNIADQANLLAGPMVLGWSIILQAMRLRVKAVQDSYDDALHNHESLDDRQALSRSDVYAETIESITQASKDDPIHWLALSAVNGSHVLEVLADLSLRLGNTSNAHFSSVLGSRMRILILELIRESPIEYSLELVSASLSALSGGQTYWDIVDSPPPSKELSPAAALLQNEELFSALVVNARARYPFEPLPFLKLARSLAVRAHGSEESGYLSIARFLEEIPTFTYVLPEGFSAYETTLEEENNNSIMLTRPVHLFEPRSKMIRGSQNESLSLVKMDSDFCIAAGTYGRMVSESNPKVAYWFHKYSGFKYFGKLLETYLAAGDQVDATTGDIADRDSVTEIIALFAVILLSNSRSKDPNQSNDEPLPILEIASSGMSRNRDVITVVFDILEEELQRRSVDSGFEVPLDLLVSCIHFIHSLTIVTPTRVWPLIGRSGLLDHNRSSGKLPSIVGGVELMSGRYDLLISCARLYEALVEDFVTIAVARKSRAKAATRFNSGHAPGTAVPDQVIQNVLLSFTRYLLDALERSCTWKFVELDDCRRLRKIITETFDKILYYTYGLYNSSPDESDLTAKTPQSKKFKLKVPGSAKLQLKIPTPKLMAPLEPAALHIIDGFLSTTSGTLRIQPLLRTYFDGFDAFDVTHYVNELQLRVSQVVAVLSLSTTLLQVSTLFGRPTSQLESQLLKISPLLARLFAVNDVYHIPVLGLFEALVTSASTNTTEPPSLVGYLGPWTSMNFLHILSDNDKPLSRNGHFVAIMHFVNKVVSGRQQWFANYLLTGSTSMDALKRKASGKEVTVLENAPLNTVLEAFANIEDMSKTQVLERFEFIALAHNFWPWATYDSPKHPGFIKSITEFIGKFKPPQLPHTSIEDSMDSTYQTRVAAYIAEILAMNLFHSRQMGVSAISKELIDNLSYFIRFAVAVPSYNSSLHANLKRNFELQYSGCKLRDFQSSGLKPRQLGQDYFYDLTLADKMLSYDQAWKRSDGLASEVATANVNLSLVDAQVALLHSWKFLAIELSTDLSSQELQKTLAKVASDCLASNRRSQGSEEIFTRLSQTRADLALILVQRLIEANSTVVEMQDLLATIWETIRTSNLSFELALGSYDPAYYRSLLKLLFLGLTIHSHSTNEQNSQPDFRASKRLAQSSTITPMVHEILDRVVAKGLRDLAAFIHDKPTESSPEDLAIITAILQACLRVPGMEFCYSQIVSTFVQHDSPRLATTLYSWSDTLAVGGDPIYGELSILFLVELSTVPAMAEQLAIEGVLTHISAANITSYLRRGNVSPFADGSGPQRCYSLWFKGLLPLALNLLDAVGVSIAAEVAIFLNQFPALLKQSSEALDAPETSRTATKSQTKFITLSVCMEIHTTSLIFFILNGARATSSDEIPEVKWDAAGVLEDCEFWLGTRPVLKERILPMGERELALYKKKVEQPITEGAKTMLEERVIRELKGIRDVLSAAL